MEVLYRPAQTNEAPQLAVMIADLRAATYQLTEGTPAYDELVTGAKSPEGIQSLEAMFAASEDDVFSEVAEVPGRGIAGFAVATKGETQDVFDYLFVHSDYHRQGIGRTLVKRAIGWSTRDLRTWVVATNTPALTLYQKQKFEERSRRSDVHTRLEYVGLVRKKGQGWS